MYTTYELKRPPHDGRKRPAFYDVDNTLSDGAIAVDFIEQQESVGVIKASDALKRAIERMRPGLTKGPYEEPLSDLLVAHADCLSGIPKNFAKEHAREFFGQTERWAPYALPTVRTMQQYFNYPGHLLSAGGDFWVEEIAAIFGTSKTISSTYSSKINENNEEILTGEITVNLARGNAKARFLLAAIAMYEQLAEKHPDEYAADYGVMLADSVADCEAMSIVQGPFCINPSLGLKQIAKDRRWPHIPKEDKYKSRMPRVMFRWLAKNIGILTQDKSGLEKDQSHNVPVLNK